ncbi:transcriptional regulator [Saccharomonospora sp. NPDC006951]
MPSRGASPGEVEGHDAPFEAIAALDKLIHEPARLAITTALSACEKTDFLFLLRLTGLSKGNLSAHLSKLEAAGVVDISKRFAGKRPETWIRLTGHGRRVVAAHWERLDEVRRRASAWSRGRS